MPPSVIVDSHQHFWDPRVVTMPFDASEQSPLNEPYLPDRLAPELGRAGVDFTVLVQALPQTLANNRWMFDLAEATPFVAGVVAWADLTRPDLLGGVLDALQRRAKFCGVRHIVDLEPDDWLQRPPVRSALRELARRGIPYDFCVRPRHLASVCEIARETPDLRFVLDHLGKPETDRRGAEAWLEALRDVARHPLAHCKLSGFLAPARRRNLEILRPLVRHALDVFGPERVVFGSDWPVCRLAGEYADVLAATGELLREMSPRERAAIMGGNAVRFYGLRLRAAQPVVARSASARKG